MSSATKIKLGILTLLLVLLGGNLLGDTVKHWITGPGNRGVVNLPCAAMQNLNTVAQAGSSYRYGYRMNQIQNGARLVPPSSMTGCVVVAMTHGIIIDMNPVDRDVVIDGETLMMLRDNDVLSFSLRIVDIEENFIEVKFVLEPGSQSFQILVR